MHCPHALTIIVLLSIVKIIIIIVYILLRDNVLKVFVCCKSILQMLYYGLVMFVNAHSLVKYTYTCEIDTAIENV